MIMVRSGSASLLGLSQRALDKAKAGRHAMAMIWRGLCLGMAALLLPGAAVAAAQGAALSGNSVACIYDGMTPEDREIALLLISREIGAQGQFSDASPNVRAVNDLIEESHDKCLARYNWSVARSGAANSYALTALLGEALGQALEAAEKPLAPLEDFYRQQRKTLTGRYGLRAADRQRLLVFLRAQGWESADEARFDLAALYVETLLLKDQARRQFTAAN